VGLLLEATRTSDEGAALAFDRATTYQATFAWRAWEGSNAAVSLEVPFLASPAFTVATAGGSLPREHAALYLTPGVRLTVNPNGLVSVFGSAGGGYARYSESKERVNGSPNPSQRDTNTSAFQFGGGVDVRAPVSGDVRGQKSAGAILSPHDRKGRRKAVLVDLKKHKRLWEDLYDARA